MYWAESLNSPPGSSRVQINRKTIASCWANSKSFGVTGFLTSIFLTGDFLTVSLATGHRPARVGFQRLNDSEIIAYGQVGENALLCLVLLWCGIFADDS